MISGYAVREHIHRNPSNPLKPIVPHKSLEILRFAQDDVLCYVQPMSSYVILNEVKNLAASADDDRRTNLEILRFAQDDVLCYAQPMTALCHSERSEESRGEDIHPPPRLVAYFAKKHYICAICACVRPRISVH